MWQNYIYLKTEKGVSKENVQFQLDKISESENAKNERVTITLGMQSLLAIVPGPEMSNQLGNTMEKSVVLMLAGLIDCNGFRLLQLYQLVNGKINKEEQGSGGKENYRSIREASICTIYVGSNFDILIIFSVCVSSILLDTATVYAT